MSKKNDKGSVSLEVVRPAAEASDVQAMLAMLREKKAQVKQAAKNQEFYAKYPWVVVDSIRAPLPADLEVLKHAHGQVCSISCQQCGAHRVVNKQDVFQVRYCQDCRVEVRKADGRAKRAAKAQDPEKLKAKMAALEAQLAQLNAA
jgi:hypothetical protein